MLCHALANADSPDKAEDIILEFFCIPVECGRVPDPRILKWMAERYRAGVGLGDIVPKLPKGKRRKRTLEQLDERDLMLARAVRRYMDHGTPYEEAKGLVAAKHNVSEPAVKKAHETFGKYV